MASGQGTMYSIFAGGKLKQSDVAAITNYANAMKGGATTAQAWKSSMGGCSVAAKQYVLDARKAGKSTDEMVAGLKQVPKATTAASVGFKALSVAANIGLTVLASFAVSAIIGWIDDLVHAQERAIEKAEEINSKFKEQQNTLANNKKTIDSISADYEKLSKGVSDTGANISLSTEEYSKYNDIVNQIADMFPTMVRGYTAEGNAIIAHKGNVEELTKAYKEQAKAARDGLISKGDEVFSGAEAELDQLNEKIKTNEAAQWLLTGAKVYYGVDAAKNPYSSDIIQKAEKLLKEQGIEKQLQQYANGTSEYTYKLPQKWNKATQEYEDPLPEDIELRVEKRNNLERDYNLLLAQRDGILSKTNSVIQAYLENEITYENQNEDIKNFISMVSSSLDPSNFDFDDDKMKAWIKNNVLIPISEASPETKQAISDLFSLDKTKIPAAEWENQTNELIDQIVNTIKFDSDEDKNNFVKQLKIKLGFEFTTDGETSVGTMIEGVKKKVQDEFDGEVDKLGFDELQIAYKIIAELPEGKLLTWDELKEKIDAATQSSNEMTVSLSELEKTSDNIKTLASAFKEIDDDGYITIETMSKIQEATKLSDDEWAEYESRLLSAKKGSTDFNQVLSELTYKILENEFATVGLENVTEEKIAAILRENNVLNANTVAHDISTKAKIKAQISSENFANATDEQIKKLAEEGKVFGLTEEALKTLQTAYGIAQKDMTEITSKSVLSRLKLLKQEVEGIKSVASAYDAIATSRTRETVSDIINFPKNPQQQREDAKRSTLPFSSNYKPLSADEMALLQYGKVQDEIQNIIDNFDLDFNDLGFSNPSSSGGESGSDKNKPDYEDPTEAIINRINLRSDELKQQEEQIENAIEIAELEKNYEKQISLTNEKLDLQKKRLDALNVANAGLHNEAEYLMNSNTFYNADGTESDENLWFDSQGNATEYYNDLINKKGITKEEQDAIKDLFEKLSKYKEAYAQNAEEILTLNKEILQDEEKIVELGTTQYDNRIRDIEHARDMELEANPYADVSSYYTALQNEYHKEAERLRALDAEKYAEEIQELQRLWWDAQNEMADSRYDVSQRYIDDRNTYGDWELFGDSEVEAWERVVKWLRTDYPNDLDKIRDAEASLFDARKKLVEDLLNELDSKTNDDFDIRISRLNSQSSLLSTHFNLVNSIAEEQHNLNKELLEAETVGARMSEQERETLFTKEEHTKLSSKLSDIMVDITDLQSDYMRDLENATEDTIEEITNQYERQYELKMKEYEVVKAELSLAKAQQVLENTKNEKSVRTWNGSNWVYESKLQDVLDAQEEVENAKYELAKSQAEEAQQTALNAIDASADALQTEKNILTSTIKDLSEKLNGSGEDISYMLKTLAKTDLPTFEEIIKACGSSLKEMFNISDKDINQYRFEGDIISRMKDNSSAWHSADEETRNSLQTQNKAYADMLGLVPDPATGRWKRSDGTYAYATGTKNAKKGLGVFDDKKGFGSELILTDGGVLTQFNGGERVFSPEMADKLWEMANSNFMPINSMSPFDYSKITPIEDRLTNIMNNISNMSGDTYMIKDVQLSESEGGTLKGFIDFLKKKI